MICLLSIVFCHVFFHFHHFLFHPSLNCFFLSQEFIGNNLFISKVRERSAYTLPLNPHFVELHLVCCCCSSSPYVLKVALSLVFGCSFTISFRLWSLSHLVYCLVLYRTVLQLCYNHFTGSIPTQLGTLKKLNVLALQSNQLTGAIPASLGDLGVLMRVDLSSNHLFGSIPSKLADAPLLEVLDIRNNKISGNVPLGNESSHLTLYSPSVQINATQLEFCESIKFFFD